jgi:hypothetical protein
LLACNILSPAGDEATPTAAGPTPAEPGETPQTPVVPPTQTAPAPGVTVEPSGPTPTAPTPSTLPAVLPAPLYYLADSGQVMRLEPDGFNQSQITHEAEVITAFDVSPADNRLAYVAGNSLIESDTAGGGRVVKVTAPPVDPNQFDQVINQTVRNPVYSPDGSQIAFGLNGANVIASGPSTQYQVVQASDPYPDLADPNFTFPEAGIRFYDPHSWSPDGSRLLLDFSFFPEAGGLAIKNLVDGSLVFVENSEGITCCTWGWSPDGQSGYVASDMFVYGAPGLVRVDALSGLGQTIINGIPAGEPSQDNPIRVFAHPYVAADGSIQLFGQSTSTFDGLGSGIGYSMFRVLADYSGIVVLRSDNLPLGEVLWARDGSGAVVLPIGFNEPYPYSGPMRWFPAGGGPALDLPADGRLARWGAPSGPVAGSGPGPAELEALKELAAANWAIQVGTGSGFEGVAVRRLLSGDGRYLWLAHTTGLRSFDPLQAHIVAVFAFDAAGWQEIARLALDTPASGAPPDYLGDGSVRQVFVEPGNGWIQVEGGIGAHGGAFNLVKFDGQSLVVAAQNSNGSPRAGFVEDLNGDLFQEVILDLSEPYVFAYAAGVRLVNYHVLTWNGSQLMPVELTRLDETAPVELRDLNNRAIDLAQANLLLDAELAIEGARALDPANQTVAWNAILINTVLRGRQQVQVYPLLERVFVGDYAGAVDTMRGYPVDQLFSATPPLIAGTAAEGFEGSLTGYIQQFTTEALQVQPDLAAAYFLRGWASYVAQPGNAGAAADVQRAAELNPGEPLFVDSANYLR